jgi:hypothetical protein
MVRFRLRVCVGVDADDGPNGLGRAWRDGLMLRQNGVVHSRIVIIIQTVLFSGGR